MVQDFVHQPYYSKIWLQKPAPTWKHLQLANLFPRLFNLPVPSWHHATRSRWIHHGKLGFKNQFATSNHGKNPWKNCIKPGFHGKLHEKLYVYLQQLHPFGEVVSTLASFCCQLVKKRHRCFYGTGPRTVLVKAVEDGTNPPMGFSATPKTLCGTKIFEWTVPVPHIHPLICIYIYI